MKLYLVFWFALTNSTIWAASNGNGVQGNIMAFVWLSLAVAALITETYLDRHP